ncbi:L,D-transpeptidase [Chthonobacter rhizosphaerae]|uniref:L,D-transpeptidase n=1 Tax=Chthonobacter rhizosphaerae TaxID=2735553 RepID=UPI003CCE23C9
MGPTMVRAAALVLAASLPCLGLTVAPSMADVRATSADPVPTADLRPAVDPVVVANLRPSVDPLAEMAPLAEEPRPQPALADRIAMRPKLVAKVSLSRQTMTVLVDGEVAHTWEVSTAGKGYRTPKGVWTPYRMHTMWYSRTYDNAPMPHSIFFTGGYAIHATPHLKRLGTPASHGCVRLHPDNARILFKLAKTFGRDRMRVVVEN